MDRIEYFSYLIENITSTKEKRHITGGFLVSLSLLFTGLAITVITSKGDKYDAEQ